MSKRDRANRFAEGPDFKSFSPISTESKPESSTSPKTTPIIVEEDDEDAGLLYKIGTFLSGCWSKVAAFSMALPHAVFSKPWKWCRSAAQWLWSVVRKIPSYCVIHWDSEEEELPKTISDSKVNAKPAIKNEPVKIERTPAENKVKVAPAIDQYDDDEPVSSRWWNIGIKTAAAAAIGLILVGGYFAVKSFFPAATSDMETVALTDQTPPEGVPETMPTSKTNAEAAPPVTAPPVASPPAITQQKIPEQQPSEQPAVEPSIAPATASPMIARSALPDEPSLAFPEPPKQPEVAAASQPAWELAQRSPLESDPFSAAPAPPIHADPIAAPSIGDNPFGAAPAVPAIAAEQPTPTSTSVPTVPEVAAIPAAAPLVPIAESPATQPLAVPSAALEPLPPLETAQTQPADPSQLQPLAALDSSVLPSTVGNAAPTAIESSTNAPVAANFRERRNNRRTNVNPSFAEAPSPPAVVSTIPPTESLQAAAALPIAEPVKEIIPQIPRTGTVEAVPPPIVAQPSSPPAPETDSLQAMSSETAPAIPKDALHPTTEPQTSENQANESFAASPIAAQELTEESVLQFLPMDDPPIDRQLRELHGESEREPAKLRFNATATTREPALRFTPKQGAAPPTRTASSVKEGGVLHESAAQFRDLLPSNTPDTLNPESNDIALSLPALENAPAPVFAEIKPAYRAAETRGEKGMTFQKRIDSEIKRSPAVMETYTIQQGDTYMTISDRFYGTSLLYTALAAHNQKSGIGWRPAEGMVIEIPTAEYLRTNYGDSTHRQERRLAAQQSAIRYIVQEGDTIFRLATDKLQDSTRWREIYALNTDRIQDIRELKPGTEILLPAETARLNWQTH